MLKIEHLLTIHFRKKNINLLIFFVLFSFLFGNVFGLNSQIILMNSSGFLFFLFPLIIEVLNFINFFFNKNFRYFFLKINDFEKSEKKNTNFSLIFISIRRGFFLGIFIEAFKLGS